MTISLDYLQSLGLCWSKEKLAEAAKSWPSPTPTWSWWLGDRLDAMAAEDAAMRFQVAVQSALVRKLRLPVRHGQLLHTVRYGTVSARMRIGRALGAYLDAVDDGKSAERDSAYELLVQEIANA